jgi:hypothetical protein
MEAKRPVFRNESEVHAYTAWVMDYFCTKVRPEHQLGTCKYRVDLAGWSDAAQRMIYVECKRFHEDQHISQIADAIMQAKSYADAIEDVFFVGPLFGKRDDFNKGFGGPLAALHLMAGHLNVGFLVVNLEHRRVHVMFKGQNLIQATPAREVSVNSNINNIMRYRSRTGSCVTIAGRKDEVSIGL